MHIHTLKTQLVCYMKDLTQLMFQMSKFRGKTFFAELSVFFEPVGATLLGNGWKKTWHQKQCDEKRKQRAGREREGGGISFTIKNFTQGFCQLDKSTHSAALKSKMLIIRYKCFPTFISNQSWGTDLPLNWRKVNETISN